MNYSNSSKDTVLQLSVGKSNSSQKKLSILKRYIIRWLKSLKNLTIQKMVIYLLIVMICCFILYPTYHNRELHHKNKADEDLNLLEPREKHTLYHDQLHDSRQNMIKRMSRAQKMTKTKKFI